MEYETMLNKLYRCQIEPTGRTLSTVNPFKLPIDTYDRITYNTEDEIAVYFSETELCQFLEDFDHFADLLMAVKDNPVIASEYRKLLVLVALYM